MYYYHFVASTPFCGTDCHEFVECENPMSIAEIDSYCEQLAIDNGDCYIYLVTGWDEEITTDIEEEVDNYYAECSCYCDQITDPQEWQELLEEYGEVIKNVKFL